MSRANFGNTVQGIANLTAGSPISLLVKYSMGYSLSYGAYGVTLGVNVGNMTRDIDAESLAASADLSAIFVSDRLSEGADNGLGLSLPGDQDAMVQRLARLSKKTLVVLNTNSAILMPWLENVDAVMEAWYSGQQVGLTIRNLLFGEVNPSGKLPMTFPKGLNDTVQIGQGIETRFVEGLYVGYNKWYDKHNVEPLFSFGHGLSYTTFDLSSLQLNTSNTTSYSNETSSIVVSTTLTNTGALPGKQVVQLYVSYPAAANEPPKLMKGFQKVHLEVDQTSEVSFLVEKVDLNIWNETIEDWAFVHGGYVCKVGFSAGDIVLEEMIYL